MSKAERPDLTDEDLDEIVRLVGEEGQRLSTVARFYGVTPQALFMRRLRNKEFAEALERASAQFQMATVRRLDAAIRDGLKTWTGYAWRLEREKDGEWLSAETMAKVRALEGPPAGEREPDPRFE